MNLRSAQDVNADFLKTRKTWHVVNVLLGKLPSGKSFECKILNFDHAGNVTNVECLDITRQNTCDGSSTEEGTPCSRSSESLLQQASSSAPRLGVEFHISVPGASNAASLTLAFSKFRIAGSRTTPALQSTSHCFCGCREKTSCQP